MNAVHIAILTPGFAVDEADTNCVPALQDYLLALQRQFPNVELSVFALRYPHTRTTYDWCGIPVVPANGRQLRFPQSLLSWARLMRSFAGMMRRRRARIVHSFWLGECAFLGERLSRLYGVPHVVTLMGQEVAVPNRYAGLLKSARTTFVAVSSFQQRALFKQTGYEARHVIPWGLDAVPLDRSVARSIDVLGVGSLTEVKDFTAFLDVAARLRAVIPTLSCRIAGDGPLRAVLEAKTRSLGLADNVRFEGRVSRERIFDLMRASKVLLHTSRFESFGLIFAEALACGARIVSRPVGIAEAGPYWALCDDPMQMAAAAARFIASSEPPPQRMHPIERTVNAYDELYRSVLRS